MKEEVWMYFNGDLFLVIGDLAHFYIVAKDYIVNAIEKEIFDLDDVLFISEYLGEL